MSTLSPRVNSLLPNMRETLADKVFATGLMAGFILWLSLGVCLPFVSKTNTIQNLSEPGGMKIKKSYLIKEGWTIWLKEGKAGIKKAVFEEMSIFGKKIISIKKYESKFIKKPVEGLVIKGLGKKANFITVNPVTYALASYRLEATAYDPSPEANGLENAGVTYLGWRARRGIAAVDPKVISLRSLLYIEGYGFAWAGDTGGDIKGKRIDLCYNTSEEAFKWGRKKVQVYVLGIRPPTYYAALKKASGKNKK